MDLSKKEAKFQMPKFRELKQSGQKTFQIERNEKAKRNENIYFKPGSGLTHWQKEIPERDKFEYELQMRLRGKAIKQTRQERKLTQAEPDKLIGVQKPKLPRLKSHTSNVTIDALMKVFSALKAKVQLQVEWPNLQINVGQ